MARGVKPKPDGLKVIQGTFQKCRGRDDSSPSFDIVEDFPSPPSSLDVDGVEMWNNVGKQLVAAKVLQVVDMYVLEQLCYSWQIFRRNSKAGMPMTAADNTSLRGLFSELGMTPASRSKVSAGVEKAAGNKFASNGKRKTA